MVVGLALGVVRAAGIGVNAQPDALPDGDGRDVVVRMCGDCHGVGPSVAKRHNRIEWQAIVDDMREKGAPGSDDEAKQTVAYLTKYFGRVNVNTAPAEELERVLDLSQSDANAIVAWRASHPVFASIDDVKNVTGIDAAKIERGKNRIVFKGE